MASQPVVGTPLTASTGTWSGSPTSFVYRWFQNGVPIIGAVSPSYIPTVGDAGKMITLGVEGINNLGPGAEAVSAAVGPVLTVDQALALIKPPLKKQKNMSVNRVNIVIPGTSSTAAGQRDEAVAKFIAAGINLFDLYHYSDTNSGLGTWGYYAIGYAYVDGIVTIITISCTGMSAPPSGSNIKASSDPGPGIAYTWFTLGAPHSISTSMGNDSWPTTATQNPYLWVWNIPGSSSTAATDFTNAITKIQADTALTSGFWTYYKYVDAVSGAWAAYAVAIFMGSLPAPVTFLVTCSGTPNPPTGSSLPAVSIPSFTQSFTTLTAPLSLGPSR